MGVSMLVVGCVATVGCSSTVESEPSATGSGEAALSGCSASDAWWKTQYDDPSPGTCEGPTYYTNCGPASIAMMRYALTCGKSNKTAAQMRSYINTVAPGATTCAGTNPSQWEKTLDKKNADGTWFADDTYAAMPTTNHCVSSGANSNYSATDLANDMASGAVTVAAVAGSAAGGQKGPCGWNSADGHALFISHWDGTYFTVYDPDSHKDSNGNFTRCGNSKPGNYKAKWTKTDLTQWSGGFSGANSGQLCVLTAKRTCVPGATTTSGCGAGYAKTCGDDFQWGACECIPGTIDACSSPDCCGTCGHATRTCTSNHTWSAWSACQNGC